MTRWLGASVVLMLLYACDGETDPEDAGMMDGAASDAACLTDGCDDGLFCTGEASCLPNDPSADARGCVAGTPPCTSGCDEEADDCGGCETPDADGDGVPSIECGGDDCDDTDPNRFPGAVEVCDTEGVDEDCDPTTFGGDTDGDGFASEDCCNGEECGRDCDDAVAGVNPLASDSCGGGDQDCDGEIDEEPDSVFFRDQDSDNFGVDDDTLAACSQPPGYVARGGDCNDDPFEDPLANQFNPGATEVCNEVDDDCDLGIDENLTCDCTVEGEERPCGFDPALDGHGICRLGSQRCEGGVYTSCVGAVPPLTMELCNFDDDDCDDETDEGVRPTCFLDMDGDTFAPDGAPEMRACECPSTHTERDPAVSADCDDSDPLIHPGADERCNRIDDDCSSGGGVDTREDSDDDGHTRVGFTDCAGGFPIDDCHDGNANVFPGQFRYFSVGYCEPGLCSCGNACEPRTFGTCPLCQGGTNGSVPRVFDYNCDDNFEDRRPSFSSCSVPCGPGFGCAGDQVRYTGTPACGSQVTELHCGSGLCDAPTCVQTTSTMTALGCR